MRQRAEWPTSSASNLVRCRPAGRQRIVARGEADRLIAERGKHFLIG